MGSGKFETNRLAAAPIGNGPNSYIAFFKGKQIQVNAATSFEAQTLAAKFFRARKSYDVTVVLAEKGGRQVTHSPMFASSNRVADRYLHQSKEAGMMPDMERAMRDRGFSSNRVARDLPDPNGRNWKYKEDGGRPRWIWASKGFNMIAGISVWEKEAPFGKYYKMTVTLQGGSTYVAKTQKSTPEEWFKRAVTLAQAAGGIYFNLTEQPEKWAPLVGKVASRRVSAGNAPDPNGRGWRFRKDLHKPRWVWESNGGGMIHSFTVWEKEAPFGKYYKMTLTLTDGSIYAAQNQKVTPEDWFKRSVVLFRESAGNYFDLTDQPENWKPLKGPRNASSREAAEGVMPNVGDIFYTSWGYDQTNVDFYLVRRVTKAMVELVEIGSKIVGRKVVADPTHVKAGPPLRKKVYWYQGDPRINIERYAIARPWDGKPLYDSNAAGDPGH